MEAARRDFGPLWDQEVRRYIALYPTFDPKALAAAKQVAWCCYLQGLFIRRNEEGGG